MIIWSSGSPLRNRRAEAKEELKHDSRQDPARRFGLSRGRLTDQFSRRVHEHLQKYLSGQLLRNCWRKCIKANTYDPYGPMRRYLFDLLRAPGEENQFMIKGRPDSRVHNLPRMPLLCGDNPITNMLPSKFFRLTDYQYYLLRQWAFGLFYNEKFEGWADPDPLHPYADWVNRTGRDLDRGVISNILGGAFCPGGEIGWVMRNPSIWVEPYRIKADPAFYNFGQTAAQANTRARCRTATTLSMPATILARTTISRSAFSLATSLSTCPFPGRRTSTNARPSRSTSHTKT